MKAGNLLPFVVKKKIHPECNVPETIRKKQFQSGLKVEEQKLFNFEYRDANFRFYYLCCQH